MMTLSKQLENTLKFLIIIYDGDYSDDNKLIYLTQIPID
jgi:hypothetical protein